MFLTELNQTEKEKFLALAYKVANADASYNDQEIAMFRQIKKETGVEIIKAGESLEDLIAYFAGTSAHVQKVVLLEICGIILSDEIVADKETDVIGKMTAAFSISAAEADKCQEAAKAVAAAYAAAKAAI